MNDNDAALLLYRKSDSWGEFVFDWAWADAWQRAGHRYFPKLVSAIPYSPVSAPKVIGNPARTPGLLAAALDLAARNGDSGVHLLFVDPDLADAATEAGFVLRHDCQFHWHNRGYGDFDEFLATLRARKRKDLRKERARVQTSGLSFRQLGGDQIDAALWRHIHELTEHSFLIRGNRHYLNADTYRLMGERLGAAVQVFLAEDDGVPVAAALCLRGTDRLYGRYWGSTINLPGLHFELCYYQGIDYCIEHGLAAFEPGAQGEHKLARGFDPVRTTSAHWLADPAFREAVTAWCERERAMVERYLETATEHTPYRR